MIFPLLFLLSLSFAFTLSLVFLGCFLCFPSWYRLRILIRLNAYCTDFMYDLCTSCTHTRNLLYTIRFLHGSFGPLDLITVLMFRHLHFGRFLRYDPEEDRSLEISNQPDPEPGSQLEYGRCTLSHRQACSASAPTG